MRSHSLGLRAGEAFVLRGLPDPYGWRGPCGLLGNRGKHEHGLRGVVLGVGFGLGLGSNPVCNPDLLDPRVGSSWGQG